MQQTLNVTKKNRRGRPRGHYTGSKLPMSTRCCVCGIGIFRDEAEAASNGVAFRPLINLRAGRHCVGCAGLDKMTTIERVNLVPATVIEDAPNEKPDKALLAAHADYVESEDGIPDIEKRHDIPNLYDKFRRAGLSIRPVAAANRIRREKEKAAASKPKRQPRTYRKLDNYQTLEAHKEYMAGSDPIAHLAKRHGVSPAYLAKRFRDIGLGIKPRGGGSNQYTKGTSNG